MTTIPRHFLPWDWFTVEKKSSNFFFSFLTRCLFPFPAIHADVGWRRRGACCSADKPVPGLGQESLSLTGWVLSTNISAVCLFASVPQLKPWHSPDIGWQGSICNHFLTPVHNVVHTSAVLPTSVTAALQLWGYLCSKISAKDLCLDGPTLLNTARKLW